MNKKNMGLMVLLTVSSLVYGMDERKDFLATDADGFFTSGQQPLVPMGSGGRTASTHSRHSSIGSESDLRAAAAREVVVPTPKVARRQTRRVAAPARAQAARRVVPVERMVGDYKTTTVYRLKDGAERPEIGSKFNPALCVAISAPEGCAYKGYAYNYSNVATMLVGRDAGERTEVVVDVDGNVKAVTDFELARLAPVGQAIDTLGLQIGHVLAEISALKGQLAEQVAADLFTTEARIAELKTQIDAHTLGEDVTAQGYRQNLAAKMLEEGHFAEALAGARDAGIASVVAQLQNPESDISKAAIAVTLSKLVADGILDAPEEVGGPHTFPSYDDEVAPGADDV